MLPKSSIIGHDQKTRFEKRFVGIRQRWFWSINTNVVFPVVLMLTHALHRHHEMAATGFLRSLSFHDSFSTAGSNFGYWSFIDQATTSDLESTWQYISNLLVFLLITLLAAPRTICNLSNLYETYRCFVNCCLSNSKRSNNVHWNNFGFEQCNICIRLFLNFISTLTIKKQIIETIFWANNCGKFLLKL